MKETNQYIAERQKLATHLRLIGIKDEMILKAIENTPRHLFLTKDLQDQAYEDTALPIECDQTISQPYIVASMTSILCQGKHLSSVLEIGTGTGYQAAILSQCVDTVYSIERIEALALEAAHRLPLLGYTNVQVKLDDGALGWSEYAPFEGIMVTAAAPEVPKALLDQLQEGGRLIMPVGNAENQQLILIKRVGKVFHQTHVEDVRFVPLLSGVRREE